MIQTREDLGAKLTEVATIKHENPSKAATAALAVSAIPAALEHELSPLPLLPP